MALAGTDTQYLIDMLEEMFGEGPMIDPEELMTADVKAKFDVAHAEEVTLAKTTGELDPAKGTVVYPKSLPIVPDFSIDPELYPENITHTEKSAMSGKMVDKFYYRCHICKGHSSQNRLSMCTHTHKCLNIKLRCPLCQVTYDSADYLQGQITKTHGGSLDPMGQSEAEAAVASFASTSKME